MNRLLYWIGLIITLQILYPLATRAQEGEIEKADLLFKELAYTDAIKIYEKLAEKDIKQEHVCKKLAQAYMKIGNPVKAEFWYSRVVVQESKDAMDLFNYSQCLKSNGKYKEADVWLNKYAILNMDDSRAENQKNSASFSVEMEEMPKKFTIQPHLINSKSTDFAPSFYRNTIAFVSSRKKGTLVKNRHAWNNKPFLDLYYFEDTAENSPPILKRFDGKINSKFHEGPACFTEDGNTIYFTRSNYVGGKKVTDNKGINHLKIFRSIKTDDKWSEPEEMSFNNNKYSTGHPALSPDGTILYFVSDMPGGLGGTDIYAFNLLGGESHGPINLGPEINTEGDEMFPFLHKDGFLFFSSNGHEGMGGLDVFIANPKKSLFYRTQNVGLPVNSPKDDFGFILDPKQSKGYFSSNRNGGMGEDDIYQFQLLEKFELGLTLKGSFAEKNTVGQKKIGNVKMRLMDENNAWLEESVCLDDGSFEFLVEPGKKYKIFAVKEGYYPDTFKINTAIGNDKYLIETNLELLKDLGFQLEGEIKDKKLKKPLDSVRITILDNIENKITFNKVTKNGFFNVPINKKLNDRVSYNIRIEKEGYFARSFTFNEGLTEQGAINLNNYIDLTLEKIVLNKAIKIENIYFDSGKWDIRKDAIQELDNMVQLLKDNPSIEIELSSHTDARGKANNNLWLSNKRAASTANYIISKGIDISRIAIKGYGEQQLINQCEDGVKCTEKEHQENRRTEFKVTKL